MGKISSMSILCIVHVDNGRNSTNILCKVIVVDSICSISRNSTNIDSRHIVRVDSMPLSTRSRNIVLVSTGASFTTGVLLLTKRVMSSIVKVAEFAGSTFVSILVSEVYIVSSAVGL